MEEQSNSDHLSSSLTDLMTSLMVIFILLLLVFVSHTASKDAALADVLLAKLRKELQPQGFNENSIRPDVRVWRSTRLTGVGAVWWVSLLWFWRRRLG